MLDSLLVVLQNIDFSVLHTRGKQNVIPYLLSRSLALGQQEWLPALAMLALICRSLPDNRVHNSAPHTVKCI